VDKQLQRGRDLDIDKESDEEIAKKLTPAKDTEAKAKDMSEAYFLVAKLFEFLHLERHIPAQDLFDFLQNPRDKKGEKIEKEIKKYFKQHHELIESNERKHTINAVFKDMTKWVGSYREFVDFIEETQVLKDVVKKMLNPPTNAKKE
jgi:hypothetical protein